MTKWHTKIQILYQSQLNFKSYICNLTMLVLISSWKKGTQEDSKQSANSFYNVYFCICGKGYPFRLLYFANTFETTRSVLDPAPPSSPDSCSILGTGRKETYLTFHRPNQWFHYCTDTVRHTKFKKCQKIPKKTHGQNLKSVY